MMCEDQKDKYYRDRISKEREVLEQPQVVAARKRQQDSLRKLRESLLRDYQRINTDAIGRGK